ncbi:MAG: DUF3604 domain-containing protein [Desulfobacterales bacterium]
MKGTTTWPAICHHRARAVDGISAFCRLTTLLSKVLLICVFSLFPIQAIGETDGTTQAKETARRGTGKPLSDDFRLYFRLIDVNQDGKIVEDEAPPELKPHFKLIDVNKDGYLDTEELLRAMSQNQQQSRTRPRTAVDDADWPPTVMPATASHAYSPQDGRDFPNRVYWGDTHLHTNMSADAYGFGNQNLTPDHAYRFAKGELITAHSGMKARLRRPLDFLVVADHSENLGVLPRIQAEDPLILKTEIGRRWAKLLKKMPLDVNQVLNAGSPDQRSTAIWETQASGQSTGLGFFWRAWGPDAVRDETFRHSVWDEVCRTADRHNDPGKFTAFIGYEYTLPPQTSNYHRVVIFEDGATKASRILPFSYADSADIEDLWEVLKDYEKRIGGKVLAIPHNGNLSNGLMFKLEDSDGNPFTTEYARSRSRWEPLYEVTQFKGDGEAHPLLSPTDEFADFETWNGWQFSKLAPEDRVKQKRFEYARSALKLGLDQQVKLGVNPFKFGMIGSTDSHTSLPTAAEDNFWGKTSMVEPSAYRIYDSWQYSASGYAAVWAKENTREALFDAMRRKEVYASTGPRITLRLFGGWNYERKDAFSPNLARIGYEKGVPMGGDLTHAPRGASSKFLIRATKDPDGANLDRIQVIKGWRSSDGSLHEKVYDVAVSDGRNIPGDGGSVESVGSTVDVGNANYQNSIGDPELAVVWTDPSFDPAELAFYYVRVIEIPKPRWTAYDKKFFKLDKVPKEIPMVVQDRAYSSPIWYTP